MEVVLDFARPLDVKLLDRLCDEFYVDGNKQVEGVLVRFQRHPLAYSRVRDILQQSDVHSCRLLALSVLEDVARHRWAVLSDAERLGIRAYIVALCIQLASTAPGQAPPPPPAGDAGLDGAGASSLFPKAHLLSVSDHVSLLRRVDVVLVCVVRHEWPARWPDFIPELVSSCRASPWLCVNNLDVLRLLSEEVFDYSGASMTEEAASALKQSLAASFTLIFTLCQELLHEWPSLTHPPTLKKATLEALQRYLHWIPSGYIFETDLLLLLCTRALQDSSAHAAATLLCLGEVATVKLSEEQERAYQAPLFDTLQAVVDHARRALQLPPMPASSTTLAQVYAEDDSVQEYVRYLTSFLSSFLRYHVASLERAVTQSGSSEEDDKRGRGAVQLLCQALHTLIQCSQVDDVVIFKIALEAFQQLVQHLYDQCRTHRQSPHSNNHHSPQQLLQQLHQTSNTTTPGASASLLPPRLSFYAPLLHQLRLVLIGHMAKPEEVLICEDEATGTIVREVVKDSDAVNLYKSMRECLIYLTHISPEDTRETMLEKLTKQVNGVEWSWHNLNTVCWAIGSVSGAMQESEEKIFLVKVIKDLLQFTEVKRGKDNKAVIASNIMYVVGQYPRFLKQHWKFLRTVCYKLFEFMHESHEGVADMSVDTFLKICRKCSRKFVTPPSPQEPPFIEEILHQLPSHISDLQGAQVCVFYEAAAELIHAEVDPAKSATLLSALMQLPNQTWTEALTQAQAAATNPAAASSANAAAPPFFASASAASPTSSSLSLSSPLPLHHPSVVKQLLQVLRVNVRVCSALGSAFFPQLARLAVDLLRVSHHYSEVVHSRVQSQGPQVVGTAEVRGMRGVQHEVAVLFHLFCRECSEAQLPLLQQQLLPPLLQALCDDYQRAGPEAREPEVLNLFATIVQRLSSPAAAAAASTSHSPLSSSPFSSLSSSPAGSSSPPSSGVSGCVPLLLESLFVPTLDMIKGSYTEQLPFRTPFFTLLLSLCQHQFPATLQALSPPAGSPPSPLSFDLLMQSAVYGAKHLERGVQELGCDLLTTILLQVRHSLHAQDFYAAYYTTCLSEVVGLATDTLHKQALHKHSSILQHLLQLLNTNAISVRLDKAAPPPSAGHSALSGANNVELVRGFLTTLLQAVYPHVSPQLISHFVLKALAHTRPEQQPQFKANLRDFLIAAKDNTRMPQGGAEGAAAAAGVGAAAMGEQAAAGGAGDDEYFVEERELQLQAERRKEQERLQQVPGLLYNPTPSALQQLSRDQDLS